VQKFVIFEGRKKCNTIFRILKFVFVIRFMIEENMFLWN